MEFIRLPPSWIDQFEPSKRPNAINPYQGGGESRLRFSNIRTQAMFRAEWNGLSHFQWDKLLNFWYEVEDFTTFTLPNSFFSACEPKLHERAIDKTQGQCTALLRKRIQAASPTGQWLFEDKPTENRVSNNQFNIVAVFRGVPD